MQIEFNSLKRQHESMRSELQAAIDKVLDASAFISGPFVKTFEDNFAQAHAAKFCIGVNNGTSALHIALWALGIKSGDEVLVPANTFFATAEAVSLTGATPVFVDCREDDFNISVEEVRKSLTPKTRAIIAVHLYGLPADMDALVETARAHNLILVEDCAQAHLATYKGKFVGSFGEVGCFSFYPGKNLGACGEAGGVITNNEKIYEKMLLLRDHGSKKKYFHEQVGHNYRMDGLQGAILNAKLKHLPNWIKERQKKAALYRQLLKDCSEVKLPEAFHDRTHTYHLFVLRVRQRDELGQYLSKKGISTGIHYPIPCHLQKAYVHLQSKALPVAEKYAQEIISLPIFPELLDDEIVYITRCIREFYA